MLPSVRGKEVGMLKVLSGLLGLVVVAGVVWVIDPLGDDDDGWVRTPKPEVSAAPPAAPPADNEVMVSWESEDGREMVNGASHDIEFTTTRDEFLVSLGCRFDAPGDLRVYWSIGDWDEKTAGWCGEPKADFDVEHGGEYFSGPGEHTVTLRAQHEDGSPYVPADGAVWVNLTVIDHDQGWVGG